MNQWNVETNVDCHLDKSWTFCRRRAQLFSLSIIPKIFIMVRVLILCIISILFGFVWSNSLNIEGSSKRVLVLLDNLAIRETHSFYFKQLKGKSDSSMGWMSSSILFESLSRQSNDERDFYIAVHILNIIDWNEDLFWRLRREKFIAMILYLMTFRPRIWNHLSIIRW